MKDRTRQDGVIFLPALHGNFFCQEVKTWKEIMIYVWPVCADIITSKQHKTVEVMVYFSPVGENCGEMFLLNSK